MKRLILALILLGLVLTPAVVNAQEPTCWPPEEWREEYHEWFTWQCDLQRQYTSETGRGLGAYLAFSQWAEIRAENEPYWWVAESTSVLNPTPKIYRRAYSYLFCDSNRKRIVKQWGWSKK